jgi:hypothetical protein
MQIWKSVYSRFCDGYLPACAGSQPLFVIYLRWISTWQFVVCRVLPDFARTAAMRLSYVYASIHTT